MVFASGVPVVMCGLDVTLRSGLSAEQLAAMRDGADTGAVKASGNAAPPNALVLSLVDAPGFQKVLGNLLQAVR